MKSLSSHTSRAVYLSLLWVALMVPDAWMNEDAFITFRVIDNLINGYGLRWDVLERVQVYTHPLWMLINIPLYWLYPNAFHVGIITGLIVSFAAGYFLLQACPGWRSQIVVALLLYAARGIHDYSTSGLENSLSHLLIILFGIAVFRLHALRYPGFWITFIISLALLTRLDMVFLYAPAALVLLATKKLPWRPMQFALGVAPLILWSVFSLIYYGTILPNTYYAKLAGDDPEGLWLKGLRYLQTYVFYDAIGAFLIPLAITLYINLLFTSRDKPADRVVFSLVPGMCAHLIYIICIGGDYMAGRFLTIDSMAAFICLVCALHRIYSKTEILRLSGMFIVWVVSAVLLGPISLKCWVHHEWCPAYKLSTREYWLHSPRLYLFEPETGRFRHHPDTMWWEEGAAARKTEFKSAQIRGGMGQRPYYAGPEHHFIDMYGLTDFFIARLQPRKFSMPGHRLRKVPRGYKLAYVGDYSKMQPDLAELVQFSHSITRGPLWSKQRFYNIYLLNTGWFQQKLRKYEANQRK